MACYFGEWTFGRRSNRPFRLPINLVDEFSYWLIHTTPLYSSIFISSPFVSRRGAIWTFFPSFGRECWRAEKGKVTLRQWLILWSIPFCSPPQIIHWATWVKRFEGGGDCFEEKLREGSKSSSSSSSSSSHSSERSILACVLVGGLHSPSFLTSHHFF